MTTRELITHLQKQTTDFPDFADAEITIGLGAYGQSLLYYEGNPDDDSIDTDCMGSITYVETYLERANVLTPVIILRCTPTSIP